MTRSPTLLLLSGLLTLAFVACAGKTQVLNAVDADAGGQEGQAPSSGGTSAAGKGGGHNQAGASGSSAHGTGGSSGSGGSNAGTGNGGSGATAGGGFPGNGGDAAIGGAGTAGSTPGGYGGTFGSSGSAGSSGAGTGNGGVGNTGNTGNTGNQGGRPSAGSAGTAGEPGLPQCNSSSGQGCSDDAFCVNLSTEGCRPDTDSFCNGYCEPTLTPPTCSIDDDCPSDMRCLPDATNAAERRCIGSDTPACEGDTDCPDGFACREQACVAYAAGCTGVGSCEDRPPDACAPGYTRAATGLCAIPCVPIQRCACSHDADCPYPSSCDRIQQRCAMSLQAPGCAMTYDPGPCDGNYAAFAFVNGSCEPVRYGGCGGNDNRFGTLEECMLRCEGRPLTSDCPDGRVAAHICLACGGGGGCLTLGDFCAETCTADRDCTTVGHSCLNGLCQAVGCL